MNARLPVSILIVACIGVSSATPQTNRPQRSGADLYRAGCAACHGVDGKGAARSQIAFDTPLPDFTDCRFTSRERDRDWASVIQDGGPARAFHQIMPAFRDSLSKDEIDRVIRYMRGFCGDRRWPSGELNLPRPLVTEKAFPEDEGVLTTAVNGGDPHAVDNVFVFEQRIGARSRSEVSVPFVVRQQPSGAWNHGLGDIEIAFKHVLFESREKGTIVAAGSGITFPTGKETEGLGLRLRVFEPFGIVTQMLPYGGFVHVQTGFEFPMNIETANDAFYLRAAVGATMFQNGSGRAWSPMVEVLTERELELGDRTQWDVLPQVQLSLSRRQHIRLNAGVRVPVTRRTSRTPALVTSFLWDWFDGGLFEGWR